MFWNKLWNKRTGGSPEEREVSTQCQEEAEQLFLGGICTSQDNFRTGIRSRKGSHGIPRVHAAW